MAPFVIYYYYKDDSNVKIQLKEGYANFFFSSNVELRIRQNLAEVQKIYKQNLVNDLVFDFSSKLNLKNEIKAHFSSVANVIFSINDDIIYIPAGRSLLAVLSEQLDVVDITSIDLPMKEFIERIRRTKAKFGTRIDNVVADYLKTVQGQIKNVNVDIAKELIHCILKADYVNDTDGEKLYFDETHWVKLIFGSSGQQEVLWILLLVFLIVLENKNSFVVLEEPEAHLYPEAQKQIMELLALTINSTGSRFLVTTHSPYILSSTNLLIQSAIVENRIKKIWNQ